MMWLSSSEDGIYPKSGGRYDTLSKAATWLKEDNLELAAEKTVCILLTGRKIHEQITISVGQAKIVTQKVVKYLKVLFPGNRIFSGHVKKGMPEGLTLCGSTLGFPNRRGCSFEARRLFYLVVEAIILYAGPIWHEAADFESTRKHLRAV